MNTLYTEPLLFRNSGMCSFPTPERYLCSQSAMRRVFSVDEALGEPVEVFESRLTDSNFNGITTRAPIGSNQIEFFISSIRANIR
jgi:hypothetical protein